MCVDFKKEVSCVMLSHHTKRRHIFSLLEVMLEEGKIDTKVLFPSHTLSLNKVSSHQCSAAARTETTRITPVSVLLNECYKYQSKMRQSYLNKEINVSG